MLSNGKSSGLLSIKTLLCIVPSRSKRIPPQKLKKAGSGDYSKTDPGKLTDIRYYQALDKSHLHRWEARSPKRKFMIKLEAMEKRNLFASERFRSQSEIASEKNSNCNEEPIKPSNGLPNEDMINDPIVIPTYIDRSPSTILRALASCVGRDSTAPHYKYHDDPFLIPYNSIQKREYILSKDGGQRAARYVLEKHPELFEKNLIYDEPKIRYNFFRVHITRGVI